MLVNEQGSAPCYRPQTLASNLAKSQKKIPAESRGIQRAGMCQIYQERMVVYKVSSYLGSGGKAVPDWSGGKPDRPRR
jgi:hypothetical protein